jgi:two-component system response regulator RegX3
MYEEIVYKQLYDHAPNPRLIFDLDGRCLLANHALSSQLGYVREDWLSGKYVFEDLFIDEAKAHEILEDFEAGKVIRHREVQAHHHDGSPTTVLVSGSRLTLEGQDVFEITLTNLTQQKSHQRSLYRRNARMNSLLEAMTAGIFLVNREGEIEETNLALRNMMQFQEEAITCSNYQELFGILISKAIEPEVVQQSLSQAVTSVNQRPTIEIAIEGDSPTYLEITLFPVWNAEGQSSGWGGLVQDVTEMRDRVSWKLELLSILAHDIRAPLASLKGHATALLGSYKQWSDEMVLDFLSAIDRSTDKLVHQVDRSLALTRVEAGRLGLKPESIAVEELVKGALERIRAKYDQIDIQLALPEDIPNVRVDPGRIEEVLINLIDNAERYSPDDQPISITAEMASAMLKISVTDRGPGIPAEDQETVFDKYTQADSQESGSGLGLFISRKIVEAHGGKIWLESPPDGSDVGTRLFFTIPVMPEQAHEKQREKTSAERSEAISRLEALQTDVEELKVLIVEDEPDFQTLMQTILHEAGYQTDVTENGTNAIDLLQMTPYDIMLLDWSLPDIQGIDVCRNVRRWSNIPILMVTSHSSIEELITALDAGADDYITKPFQSEEILARMRAILRRKEGLIKTDRDQISSGGILINFDSQEIWSHGKHVELTPTEFKLFSYLTRNEGQVLTYDQLLDHIYDADKARKRHDLFVHISRLRKKLEPNPDKPRYILTRWGVGYMFKSE